jgi:hypothetical protein
MNAFEIKFPFVDNQAMSNRQVILTMVFSMLSIIVFGFILSKSLNYSVVLGLHDVPLFGPRLAAYDRVAPNDAYYYLASLPVFAGSAVAALTFSWRRYVPDGTYVPATKGMFANPHLRLIICLIGVWMFGYVSNFETGFAPTDGGSPPRTSLIFRMPVWICFSAGSSLMLAFSIGQLTLTIVNLFPSKE